MDPYPRPALASTVIAMDPLMYVFIIGRLAIMLAIGTLILYGIYRLIKPSTMETTDTSKQATLLRNIYFYSTTFIGLIMIIIGVSSIINTALKATIFTKADYGKITTVEDECTPEHLKENPGMTSEQCAKRVAENNAMTLFSRSSSRHSTLAFGFGMLIMGTPLFAYHFLTAQRERNALKK